MQDPRGSDRTVLEFESNEDMVNCAAGMFNDLRIADTEPVGLRRLAIPAEALDNSDLRYLLLRFRTATILEDRHDAAVDEGRNPSAMTPLESMVKDSGGIIDRLRRQYFERHGVS